MATVAVPSEDQLALLTPTQQRHIMRDLAAKLRTLRDESARAKARLDEIGNPANIKVVDAGLNVAGAFSAGAVYEALQARIDAGTLDEKWLHVGGGIDTTLLGSLGLALAGVALANYGENSAEQPDAELSDEGTETRDESWYSAQNVGAGLAKLGLGGVMLWAGRIGGKAYTALAAKDPETETEEEGGDQAA